jgi:hypothetical protein
MTPANYTVGRNPKEAKRWAILQDGELIRGSRPYDHPDSYYKTKKDATARMEARIERDGYEAKTLAEDKSGHIWTEEEAKQIAEYAALLLENKTQNSLWGQTTPQEHGRKQHFDEIRTITSHYGLGEPGDWGNMVCAEIRRRCAARVEAFRQAGLVLTNEHYTFTARRTNHPTKECEPNVFSHRTRELAEEAQADLLKRAPGFGEIYETSVDEVPAAWPVICKFQEEL